VTDDPNLANPNSEVILLTQEQPYRNHNGGGLDFGPDGYLYISLGDGGSAGDPLGAGQSLNTLLGKILRIDINTESGYRIPRDNPFASQGGLPEIWAYGLRNAWRIAFDPATGDLYIADVGQNQWEEINVVLADTPGGLNFGWDLMEGNHPFEGAYSPDLTLPVVEYSHDQGCSVTGGYVYRGQSIPEMQGVYLFGDFCSGNVWGLLKSGEGWVSSILFRSGIQISTFGQDEAGEIYMGGYNGTLYRLEPNP
jgi:glucose/arabinose dehydrogenase